MEEATEHLAWERHQRGNCPVECKWCHGVTDDERRRDEAVAEINEAARS